jgi:hypothetical protein
VCYKLLVPWVHLLLHRERPERKHVHVTFIYSYDDDELMMICSRVGRKGW